jgi:cholest-4-en-3-one 26-monooxygenase
MALTLDSLDLVNPERYVSEGYPYAEWEFLRHRAPLFWYDRPNVRPFWAVTKHADIIAISRAPELFLSSRRFPFFVVPRSDEGEREQQLPVRNLLQMDLPEHRHYRALTSSHFTPRALRKLEGEVTAIARAIVDGLYARARGAPPAVECDFVLDVSARLPLAVIAAMLGIPPEDRATVLRWTNEVIGGADPEFQSEATPAETSLRAKDDLFRYFMELCEQRRQTPREDLVSVLVAARINGEPLPVFELMSYFHLLVVAGNETTRNATSGGLVALIQNPNQWRLLRENPAMLASAIEEILRWTSPVIQFTRTAARDLELRGQRIREGEDLALYYPSANRDEEVFEAPNRFDITRQPNPHLAFGIGEHVCLGANLARLELKAIFAELLRRVEHAELTGPIERLRSVFVGGIKHLPVRLTLRPTS